MFNHYVNCIKKYVQFSGCSTRSEYWYFVLANFIIALLVNIFAKMNAVIGLMDLKRTNGNAFDLLKG